MRSAEAVRSNETAPPRSEPGFPKLSYQPALDGLRAVAVGGVLLYHHSPSHVPGGWLGVSLFFTLSGFLIGSLALAERETTGGLDLLTFWARRIRRLMPAGLLALLLAFSVVLLTDTYSVSGAATDIRAAALYFANWHFISADVPYADVGASASPVLHYWSLAIEEQFYLLFPLLMLVSSRRPRILAPVLIGVIALGLTLQLTLSDFNRIYYGSDSRAPELAVGVLLALAFPQLRSLLADRRRLVDLIGIVGMSGLAATFLFAHLDLDLVQSGALTAVTVVWTCVIIAALWGRSVPRLLATRPLPAIGRISYGIYLYHWPIYLVVTPQRTGLSGLSLLAARLALTIALAAASAVLVENRIRRGTGQHRRTFALAGAGVAALVLVAVVVPRVQSDDAIQIAGSFVPPPVSVTMQTTPAIEVATNPEVVETTEVPEVTVAVDQPDEPIAPAVTTPTVTTPTVTPVADRVPRVLVAGDSTANAIGTPMQTVGAEDGLAEVYIRNMPGCSLLPYSRAKLREGHEQSPNCPDIAEEIVDLVRTHDIDAVVLFIGSPQLMDLRIPGLSGWRAITDPEVQHAYLEAATDAIDRLNAIGVPILWADVPEAEWDLEAFGDVIGSPLPGVGVATTNEAARTTTLNRLDDLIADTQPNVHRWGYADSLSGPGGMIPPEARIDGLHLEAVYGETLARTQLFSLIEDAYRTVRSRPDTTLNPPGLSTWDVPG